LTNLYSHISQSAQAGKKMLAFLMDPDHYMGEKLTKAIALIHQCSPDIILIGGSLTQTHTDPLITELKKKISQPVVLYPGSLIQLSPSADAILLISLLSGRNPDYLIGNHVIAAPFIKQSGLEVIPTGYLLIDGGQTTSVEYMSQTRPIPANKPDIAVATALAGEQLGMKLIYLEAGSGAKNPVAIETIKQVKKALTIPLIVGGGLNTTQKIKDACDAGADLIVIGNALEKDPMLLSEFTQAIRNFNQL